MDGERFDTIVRALATRESRRRVVGGLVGSAGGIVLAALGRRETLGAPDECAVYCARQEPAGPARAACKQACQKCGAEIRRVCRRDAGYTCCPRGEVCGAGGACVCFPPDLPSCPDGEVRDPRTCQCVPCPDPVCDCPDCPAPRQCIAGRCVLPCGDVCAFEACNACATTFDYRDGFCADSPQGCEDAIVPCMGHGDCQANELCTDTSCGPESNPQAARCLRVCAA